jgi:hypothetical protein
MKNVRIWPSEYQFSGAPFCGLADHVTGFTAIPLQELLTTLQTIIRQSVSPPESYEHQRRAKLSVAPASFASASKIAGQ